MRELELRSQVTGSTLDVKLDKDDRIRFRVELPDPKPRRRAREGIDEDFGRGMIVFPF